MNSKKYFWYRFIIIWTLGVLSTLAVMPYLLVLQSDTLTSLPVSLGTLILISVAQSGILLAIIIGLGLKMADSIGIQTPLLKSVLQNEPNPALKKFIRTSIILGAIIGTLIFVGDKLFAVFIPELATVSQPALWKGLLASFYGGITEEILMRLFLMTLLLWIIVKVIKVSNIKENVVVVTSVITVIAVIFGLLHLPATALVVDITPLIVVRALVLNGIGAIVFGWLYWRHGLEFAMISHFTTDVILQSLQSM